MEIKLGKTHRIRLEQSEVQDLSRKHSILDTFQLTPSLRIDVQIQVDNQIKNSGYESRGHTLIFSLCERDLLQLSETGSRRGINIEYFNIQQDLWSPELRQKKRDA